MTFTTGTTYEMRWIGDADARTLFTIVARTAKTVTVDGPRGVQRCRVTVRDGVEQCAPFGSYSMSPVLCAERPRG